uniref:Nop domain-containing protein n=1 Tax=Strongyloides papillosus TaxID=174720 RepID=A0A0N5C2W7_STREA
MSIHEHEDDFLLIEDDGEQVQPQGDNEPAVVNPQVPEEDVAFLDVNALEGEVDLDAILGRYSRNLRSMGATVEAVLLLMEMGEEVSGLERKLLWAKESHITVLNSFENLTSIHDAGLAFIRRRAALLAAVGENPTVRQKDAIDTKAKSCVSKRLDYQVARTTEDIMSVYQSIAKIEATCLRIKHVFGKLSGRLSDKLGCLWIDGSVIPSPLSPASLIGLSSLQMLIVSGCDTLKLLLSSLDKNIPLKVIVSLCKPHKCLCKKHIRATSQLDLPFKIVIVPDRRYNGQAITQNATVRKNLFFHRMGTIYYKNSHWIKTFAECEYPEDIAEIQGERKEDALHGSFGIYFLNSIIFCLKYNFCC